MEKNKAGQVDGEHLWWGGTREGKVVTGARIWREWA